jgi:hypothetical protein
MEERHLIPFRKLRKAQILLLMRIFDILVHPVRSLSEGQNLHPVLLVKREILLLVLDCQRNL